MQRLSEEQKLLIYARTSKEICQRSGNCKECPDKNNIMYLSDASDLFGCSRANNLVGMAEYYQRKFGENEKLDSALITLTAYSKVEGILNNKPNRDGVLGTFERIEAILSDITEEKDEEIEKLPVEPEIYPVVSVSRRAAQLLK